MISFTVLGTPVPQGSMRSFIPKGWNRAVITTDNTRLKPWRQELGTSALIAMREAKAEILPRPVPVQVVANFYFAKPKSAKKTITAKTTKPDLDKLARSLMDSMSGIVFEDDSQVVLCCLAKCFGLPERTEIKVSEAR